MYIWTLDVIHRRLRCSCIRFGLHRSAAVWRRQRRWRHRLRHPAVPHRSAVVLARVQGGERTPCRHSITCQEPADDVTKQRQPVRLLRQVCSRGVTSSLSVPETTEYHTAIGLNPPPPVSYPIFASVHYISFYDIRYTVSKGKLKFHSQFHYFKQVLPGRGFVSQTIYMR